MSTSSKSTSSHRVAEAAPSTPVKAANDNRTDGAFIIETGNIAAGIVVRQAKSYRFFAAHHDFRTLDGTMFANPVAAQKAADLVHTSIKLAAARERLGRNHREAGT